MKKLFLLAAVFAASMAVNAADAKMWNVSEWSSITPKDTLIAPFTIDGMTVTAADSKKNNKYNAFVMVDGNEKTGKDGKGAEFKFTKRLKLSGAGDATYRTIQFPVAKGQIVEIWGMSSSSDSGQERDVNVDTEFGTTVNTFEKVGGDALKYLVYKYEGDATSLLVYSKAGGFNVYAIRVGADVPTGIENAAAEEVKAVKTFENGQLVIIKNGVKYNATGAVVR